MLAMPAYTHLQPAEPVLVAHWLLAYVEMFLRDADAPRRLPQARSTFVRWDRAPLLERRFRSIVAPWRRNWASMARPRTASMRPAIATSSSNLSSRSRCWLVHLSRWAEEMILFSTPELRICRSLPEPYSTGSSAMPQKKNPDLLELLRGQGGARDRERHHSAVAVKGLPLAYNKDLQETQEPLFDAADTVLPYCRL